MLAMLRKMDQEAGYYRTKATLAVISSLLRLVNKLVKQEDAKLVGMAFLDEEYQHLISSWGAKMGFVGAYYHMVFRTKQQKQMLEDLNNAFDRALGYRMGSLRTKLKQREFRLDGRRREAIKDAYRLLQNIDQLLCQKVYPEHRLELQRQRAEVVDSITRLEKL